MSRKILAPPFPRLPFPPPPPPSPGRLLAALLQPPASAAMAAMARRHPGVFERLAPFAGAAFLIDPVDLPIAFVLVPDAVRPRLRVTATPDSVEAVATVRGTLVTLIALLEGRVDGDALFFSRALRCAGDTEAILTLRNAVDGAEIRVVDDLVQALGPLAVPARRLLRGVGGVLARAAGDLGALATVLAGIEDPAPQAAQSAPAGAGR